MMEKTREETVVAYESGLTWRSFLSLLYCSVILMPASMFSVLVTGIGLAATGGVAGITMPVLGFVAVFLAAEIARLGGSKLTRQELFIIWSHSLSAAGGGLALQFINQTYLRSISPVTWSFFKMGKPLPLVIPDFYAPPPGSEVLLLRTLFHPDMMMPIILFTSLFFLTWVILPAILGFINYQLFAVGEKLPFPIAQVQAETVITLAERETRRYDLLMGSGFLSAGYAVLAYFLPFALGLPQIVPIPWVDLTRNFERTLPGAAIGIQTDILSLAVGLMLPLNVVIGIFIGSIGSWIVGNTILVGYGVLEHRPGMNIALILQQYTLNFWAFPQIGLAVAAALIPIVIRFRTFGRAIKGFIRVSGEYKRMGVISVRVLILFFMIASSVWLGLLIWLTDFPWFYLALLIFGWGLVQPMVSTRALGETGIPIGVPYVFETVVLLSGYPKADIWFTKMEWMVGGGADVASWFKVCELTRTTISSWLKAWFIITPIAWGLSFLYAEVFWKIAPIPSAMYPATSIQWPVGVVQRLLWVTGAVGIGRSQMLIAYSFIIGVVIALLNQFAHLPISLISLTVGVATPPPTVLTLTIGAIIARVLIRRLGIAAWTRDRSTIVAGIFLGQSIVIALAVGATMLSKSLWPLPF